MGSPPLSSGSTVQASVTAFDGPGIDRAIRLALDAGATPEQVHEALVVGSGLGVHTLRGARTASPWHCTSAAGRSTPPRRRCVALRKRLQGDDPYWKDFEREIRGFLDSLLRLSLEAYEAFFAYRAVPFRGGPPLSVAE
jgi:hypothetical protein